MKRAAKAFVQRIAAAAAPAIWRLRSNSLVILMYHRVLPADHPDREAEQPGMYVSPQTLAMHLETLQRHFALVHLEDWVTAVNRGNAVPPRACAITFDDGWKDNYDFAYPVLRAMGAPATIFLVSDMVGSNYTFWPNRLARLLCRPLEQEQLAVVPDGLRKCIESNVAPGQLARGLALEEIDRVIAACKQNFADSTMLDMLNQVIGSALLQRDLMSWEEIREMSRSGLVHFGSHTRRHTRLLAEVSRDAMMDEIDGSRILIERTLGIQATTFCYPNGDVSAVAEDMVRRSYAAAVTTRSGWNTTATDLHRLVRIGVHEDVAATTAAFMSRLVGIG